MVDTKLMDGHVWMPNGFGMTYPVGEGSYDGLTETIGVNMNDYTDIAVFYATMSGFTHFPGNPFNRANLRRDR